MKTNKSKRDFIKKMGLGLTGLFLFNVFNFRKAKSNYRPKIVIIGGGIGGASCLRYLSDYSSFIELSIIEKNKKIQTCPFSNLDPQVQIEILCDLTSLNHQYHI